MMSFAHEQRGFASAEEPFDKSYVDDLVVRRSARLVELFLKCFRRRLTSSAVGLDTLLDALVADLRASRLGAPFDTMWSSALGQLRLALLTAPQDEHHALVAASGLAIHLAEKGRAVAFEVTLDRPETFRFGHHVLAAAPRSPFSFTFASDGRGSWEGASSAAELVRVETTTRSLPILPASALPDGESVVASTRDPALCRPIYESAFALLADCAPRYRDWVDRMAHALLPLRARAGTMTSSSFEHWPGVIALSHESPAITLADLLVHEASHQHFYLLTQLGPVDDGSDPTLYWSAAKMTERPIDKILLAYHAFANVLLFYRQCRKSGKADADFCLGQERGYEECVAELQRPLETTRALTPLGRALFEPLAQRVGAAVGVASATDHDHGLRTRYLNKGESHV